MLDPAIKDFLQERKEARIKSKTKASMTDEEKQEVIDAAEEALSLASWLPSAAKRASQLSMVSHPGKFTHPSAKTSSLIAESPRKADGFLRTGNVETSLDVFGNAAALDVYKFLMLKMEDGRSVLEHLEANTDEIQQQLGQLTTGAPANADLFDSPQDAATSTTSYNEIKSGLLAIKQNDDADVKTHERIKQVYFPVDEDYHLLSIFTPSGLMFALKDRINHIRFSDEAKSAREARKKGQLDEQGFAEIYDLTVIGFGGTKPQNVSVKNSQSGGKAYLLPSMPPTLQQQSIQLPRRDFFSNSLNPWHYREEFQSFHTLVSTDHNNVNIRNAIDNLIQFIITQIIEKAWALRRAEAGWSEGERYSKLPRYQKIWLDNAYTQEREDDDDWLAEIEKAMARWFLLAYRKVIKQPKGMGDDELPHIKRIINNNWEGLR